MSVDYKALKTGDVLEYEDRANPPKQYVVLKPYVTDFGSEWELIGWKDNRPVKKYSDCRQAGWKIVTEESS